MSLFIQFEAVRITSARCVRGVSETVLDLR